MFLFAWVEVRKYLIRRKP